MNKWIVVTTINAPTKAIRIISAIVATKGWRCVVVGDKKTPVDWASPGIDYLSYDEQLLQYGELASLLPANHYCRKNIGYLYAMERGAQLILETDDDNIPFDSFGMEIDPTVSADLVSGSTWVNVYKYFTDSLIWPRGNPLDTIHDSGRVTGQVTSHTPIQQFLADGDPDVDAIYRLVFKAPLNFDQRTPVMLEQNTWCSFNSQNTAFFHEAFALLYLPCHVSFRMTDIWRSFVAQAGLWSQGHRLVFRNATVVQERNEHNLMKDFREEVDGYLNNHAIADCLSALLAKHRGASLPEFATHAWQALFELGVVKAEELTIHKAWLARCLAAA